MKRLNQELRRPALHDLYRTATQPDTRLLLTLRASGFYVGAWTSKRTDVLAALRPLAVLDNLDAEHGNVQLLG